jgi:hypothetical protein
MFQTSRRIFSQRRKLIFGLAALVILGILALQSVQADSIFVVDTSATHVTISDTALIGGKPAFAYWDADSHELKLAVCANPACETGTTTITTLDTRPNVILVALAEINGNPFVAYFDSDTHELKVISCTNLTCDPAASPHVLMQMLYSNQLKVVAKDNVTGIVAKEYAGLSGPISTTTIFCYDIICNETPEILHPTVSSLSDTGGIDATGASNNIFLALAFSNYLEMMICASSICNLPSQQSILVDQQVFYAAPTISLTLLNGNPVVAYPLQAANTPLKIAFCADTKCINPLTYSTTSIQNVTSGFVLQNIGGTLKIAYVKNNLLKLASCTNSACSSMTETTVPTSDTNKQVVDMIDVNGSAGITYLSGNGTLKFYYVGNYMPTQSPTPSQTPVPPTITPTPTFTPSKTPTPVTPTNTLTPSPTKTNTPTPTRTPSKTPTPTYTPITYTPTASFTPSKTSLPAPSNTPKPTNTPTPTITKTPTVTPVTPTLTPTITLTPSATATASSTATDTDTPTPTATQTPIPSDTATSTATATSTTIPTLTPTSTHTPTSSPTPTALPPLGSMIPPSDADAAPTLRLYTTKHPTLTWTGVAWASSYDLDISPLPEFVEWPVYEYHGLPANQLGYTTPDALPSDLYYYRVRAIGADGTVGAWSTPEPFIVLAP